MTNILLSKLGQQHMPVARELDKLREEGNTLGATEGAQRLELICDQYNQLSPNTAYLWLDLNAFQDEIEETQMHTWQMEWVHRLRNLFSLAPLILTWLALSFAVSSYQTYTQLHHDTTSKAFLELWQGGFGGTTIFNFSFTAITDVVLLLLYLSFVLLTHEMERRAHACAIDFVKKLQTKVDELIKYIIADTVHIGDQSDIERVISGVKQVVDSATGTMTQLVEKMSDGNKQAIDALQQAMKLVVADAQKSIQQSSDVSTKAITASNQQVETLFNSQVMPIMKTFNTDMSKLHQELGNYQGRLNDLTSASQQLANASQQLANASSTLTDNAEQYTTIGEDISTQIASLNSTQDRVLQQIEDVAGGITTVASNMAVATTDMRLATESVGRVASQLDTGLRTTMDKMTHNIYDATNALAQVGPQLYDTSTYLYQAATMLAGVQQKKSSNPLKKFFTRPLGKQKAGPQGARNI